MSSNFVTAEDNKPRIRLGEAAIEIAREYTKDGEQFNGQHVEAAINALQQKIQLLMATNSPSSRPLGPLPKRILEREMDQLFHEITQQAKQHHDQTVDMLNGLRHLLTNFAEEFCSDEALNAIRDINSLLDDTVKPMAVLGKQDDVGGEASQVSSVVE